MDLHCMNNCGAYMFS